jgi:AraC-like DNA-binding protein/quercetin dioxygenase-like cupin family protein
MGRVSRPLGAVMIDDPSMPPIEPPLRLDPVEVRLPPSGVFVLESHHGPGFRMPASSHEFLEVFYVLRGHGRFLIEGRTHSGRDGDVVVIPTGKVHRIEDDPVAPLWLYGICVAAEVWSHEPSLLDPVPAGRLPSSGPVGSRVRSDLRHILFEQTSAGHGSVTSILGMTLQLLALLARSVSPKDEAHGHRQAVERYAADLKQRFFEAADLDSVAEGLDMSRRRFTQLFREVTGETWADHLAGLRVDYARQLLEETDRSVVAIAFESGFEEVSSFYRAFKKRTGMAPNQWRQVHRKA